ncbi:MAG: hypothetical protein ABIJ17_02500 [Patescibacteria group bacterium]
MNSKIDTFLAKGQTKEDCRALREACRKDDISPLKAFQYKLVGAMFLINILIVWIIKKFG